MSLRGTNEYIASVTDIDGANSHIKYEWLGDKTNGGTLMHQVNDS